MAYRIALIGNPNCGKTTLFNLLTGSSQSVGNWPGVTVEKKVGRVKGRGGEIDVVDLPGIYSLSPYTMEEAVTRDYLIGERPDAVIDILDGTNPERNLYLTLQVMELGLPLALAVNMMDEVAARGDSVDCRALGELLGAPAVPIAARNGQGVPELLKSAEDLARGKLQNAFHLRYDDATENALNRILYALTDADSMNAGHKYAALTGAGPKDTAFSGAKSKDAALTGKRLKEMALTGAGPKDTAFSGAKSKDTALTGGGPKDTAFSGAKSKDAALTGKRSKDTAFSGAKSMGAAYAGAGHKGMAAKAAAKNYPLPFCASKLLEGDGSVAAAAGLSEKAKKEIEVIVADYERKNRPGSRETLMADARYRLIARIVREAVARRRDPEELTLSDRIDRIATGRWTAIPVFFFVMLGMFSSTFGGPGQLLGRLVESAIAGLGGLLSRALDFADAPAWVRSLFLEAALGGVGGVLSFLPQVSLLFLFLSVLEDSGYMARAAFIMDRLFRKIGLTGRSFIPMLMGFGCTTPAVMAAKGMAGEKERRLTILLTPFMSCSARLPIYGLFAGIFFAKYQGLVIFSMYLAGMLTAMLCGLLLKGVVCPGESPAFVMELPPYRLPAPANLTLHVWEKCRGFLIKAGTVIFSMSVAIWFLQNFGPPFRPVEAHTESFFGIFGRWIAPVFVPLGFGNWQSSAALLVGLIAKESVVSTLHIVFGAEGIAAHFTPVSAYSFMLFCLLYMPCVSAFVTVKKELGSWAGACRNALFQTAVAWLVAFAFYQVAMMISHLAGGGPPARGAALAAFLFAGCGLIALALYVLYKTIRNLAKGGASGGCAGCPMRESCEKRAPS